MKIISSILHADYIAAVVGQFYAIGDIKKCTFISQGLNDTYLIICEQGKFIARVYRHLWRSLDEINAEIDFVTHLATHCAPVAQFILSKDGHRFHALPCPEGERVLVLMECASGSEYETHAIPNNSPFNYGKSVGLMHNAANHFASTRTRRPLNTDHLIWQPLAAVKYSFKQNSTNLEYLRAVADQLTIAINRLETAGLTKMFIHGDLTGGNANQDANGSYTLFDFDCCGFGWQAYDLAVFLWSLIQNKKAGLWPTFLDGYRSVAQLNPIDEKSIGLFVAARSFWIMGYSMSRVPILGSHSYKETLFVKDVEFIKQLSTELPKDFYIDPGAL